MQEIAMYGDRVVQVQQGLKSLYYRTIEETDNAVLFDQYDRNSKALEAARASTPRKK